MIQIYFVTCINTGVHDFIEPIHELCVGGGFVACYRVKPLRALVSNEG